MERQRKIIHIDMDAFYAAVEQRDNPRYRHRPLIVGGDPAGRGVVATCSYEARRFGIHSAMPAAQACRLCPEAIFVRPRFEVYREVSRDIRGIFGRHTDRVEPLSLDEAYLDVSDATIFQGSATLIAKDIKQCIRALTGLTASAGVSYNKLLAKLASDIDKPDGLYVITPDQGPAFVAGLPIGKFHGIGKATEAKMKALGIHSGADLKRVPLAKLLEIFGKAGSFYYQAARGIDERPVVKQRIRKSVSSETTFERDVDEIRVMLEQLERLAGEVEQTLAAQRLAGHTLTIKVRYANFELISRSITFASPLRTLGEMCRVLPQLLARTDVKTRRVRLLGVGVSKLVATGAATEAQGGLF